MRNRVISAAAAVCALAGSAAAQTPVGTGFTYQGRLTDNGQPANGLYDLHFGLYDAPVAGTAVVPFGLYLNDVQVTAGVFTVTLDFGAPAFNGDARWLNISVRPGASGGVYTGLSPRQPLTPAPYAIHALNAGSWIGDGAAITNGNEGFVGINRSAPINTNEVFGIQAPVQLGYGGMYIRTDGEAGKPFYGYRADTKSAWSYLDGPSGDWRLYNGGERMTVTDQGTVGIGTMGPQAKLHVHNPSGSTNNSLYAVTYGSGKAAVFESHESNAMPAVAIYKNQGTALQTTGDVRVNGKVYADIGGAQHRATPIAYCTFTLAPAPQIVSSSGNVSVYYNFDPAWPAWVVTVSGETDPDTWVVTSNLMLEHSEQSAGVINMRVGTPNANGTFKIAKQCVQNCQNVGNYGTMMASFVIYKP